LPDDLSYEASPGNAVNAVNAVNADIAASAENGKRRTLSAPTSTDI
jgi:hypothetical protein